MHVSIKYIQSRAVVVVFLSTEIFLFLTLIFIYTRCDDPPLTVPARKVKFLHPKQLLPTTDMFEADWIVSLKNILSNCENLAKDKFVISVICTESYYKVLVNWLAGLHKNTELDVADVLIIVTEEEIYHKLRTRKLSALYVRKESVLREPEKFSRIRQTLMIRCAVARLLNHWGYDMAMIDLDAIVLRDPRAIFHRHPHAEIVASRGTFPRALSRMWGHTLCMGFILFRSSPAIGKLTYQVVNMYSIMWA